MGSVKRVGRSGGSGGGGGAIQGYLSEGTFYKTYEGGTYSDPITPKEKALYVDKSTSKLYRYNGTGFQEIAGSAASSPLNSVKLNGETLVISDGAVDVRVPLIKRAYDAIIGSDDLALIQSASVDIIEIEYSDYIAKLFVGDASGAIIYTCDGDWGIIHGLPDGAASMTWQQLLSTIDQYSKWIATKGELPSILEIDDVSSPVNSATLGKIKTAKISIIHLHTGGDEMVILPSSSGGTGACLLFTYDNAWCGYKGHGLYEATSYASWNDLMQELLSDYSPIAMVSDITTATSGKADKVSNPTQGNLVSLDSEGNLADAGVKADNIAQKDGYYAQLVAGSAENIVGRGSVGAEFTARPTAGTQDVGVGAAQIKKIKGNTIKWNQLCNYGSSVKTSNGITWTRSGNKVVASGTGTSSWSAANLLSSNAFVSGHKYYYRHEVVANPNELTLSFGLLDQLTTSGEKIFSAVIIAGGVGAGIGIASGANGVDVTGVEVSFNVFDLTEMGIADIIGSPADFEALFGDFPYAYTPTPVLVSNNAEKLVTDGFNLFNKDTVITGYVSDRYGTVQPSANARTSDWIEVLPNTQYYVKSEQISGRWGAIYDKDKNFITGAFRYESVFTTPANAKYIRLTCLYNGNGNLDTFCLNLSHSGVRNGEYEPHWSSQLPLDLTTITGKVNVEGESVTIFPNGMQSNGTTYDELDGIKAIKRIDTDNSVLATPVEYILDEPLSLNYRVDDFGTERIAPSGVDTNAVPKTAPFVAEIVYPMNAADTLRNLPKNYISKESMDAILTAFKTAGVIANYTLTYDATTGKYTCSITPIS